MAHWATTTSDRLKKGNAIKDPRTGYIGKVLEVRTRGDVANDDDDDLVIIEVAWLKWDPKIEKPMRDTYYTRPSKNAVDEVLVLRRDYVDDDDLQLETMSSAKEWLLREVSRQMGREFTIDEWVTSFMGRLN